MRRRQSRRRYQRGTPSNRRRTGNGSVMHPSPCEIGMPGYVWCPDGTCHHGPEWQCPGSKRRSGGGGSMAYQRGSSGGVRGGFRGSAIKGGGGSVRPREEHGCCPGYCGPGEFCARNCRCWPLAGGLCEYWPDGPCQNPT